MEIIKKNKIKKVLLLIISLLVLIVGLSQKPANRMKNLMLDQASLANLSQTKTPSDKNLFEQILFDDLPLIIDSQENIRIKQVLPTVDQEKYTYWQKYNEVLGIYS